MSRPEPNGRHLRDVSDTSASDRDNAKTADFSIEFAAPEHEAAPVFEELMRVVVSCPDPVLGSTLAVGSEVSEEFRILAARIRSLSRERPLRCFGVVSACPEEGKTTLAVGLAVALAQEPGRRVLLVEADLRRPSLEKYLGLNREFGVGDWLEGTARRVAVRRIMPQGFFLLPAGRFPSRRPELLQSERMRALLELARGSFDAVILDCPPLVPVADSLLLQDLLDGFVFVVRARSSPLETVTGAMAQLKPDRVAAVVLNDQREPSPRYYEYTRGRRGGWRTDGR
jgi:capsular exopolysaccharide synthesis family protein